MSLKKAITLALATVSMFAVWRAVEGTDIKPNIQLQTTFDFDGYPACGPSIKSNCIVSIQFYDATSHHILATAATTPGMRGRQVIVANPHTSSFPRRVYATTVYLDNYGHRVEGARGQTSEYGYQGDLRSQR
jgi:hypothetical protein